MEDVPQNPGQKNLSAKLAVAAIIIVCLIVAGFKIWQKPSPAQKAITQESIAIRGDAACAGQTTAALNLLKQKSPQNYRDVETFIGIIDCEPKGSGMYANEQPPRFVAGQPTRDAGTIWYAGAIVHDAHHSKLYHDYLALHPGQPVPGEVWMGKTAESECIEKQKTALMDLGANQATLDYLKNAINTNYWDNPNRNW